MRIPQPTFRNLGPRRAILTEDYDAGDFIVPAAFQFDGATIPWWAWSLIRLDPFGRISGPACGHDFLYVTCGRVLGKDGRPLFYTEDEADEYFYHRCQAENVEMNWLQERLVRRAVFLFGDYDYKKESNVYIWNSLMIESYLERYRAAI